MFKRILIATDGSPLSQRAITQGVAVAKLAGAAVVGFHARPTRPAAYYGEAAVMLPQEIVDKLENESIADAERCLAEVAAAARQAGVTSKVVQAAHASPADAILEAAKAEGCDLIVMASHGRKGLARVLLGSETMKVLTHASVPVLVTR